MLNRCSFFAAMFSLVLVTGCTDVEHDHHDHEHEVMTTIMLTFTSQNTGEVVEAEWADIEGDGNPVIDDIALVETEVYDFSIAIWNELETPAEEVTPEILEEALEHQVFVYGSSVLGPASDSANAVVVHDYADADSEGNPLGLENTITAVEPGTGVFSLLLRHMPYQDGNSVKTSTLADDFLASGESALPGASDFAIDFDLEVL